MDFNRSDSVQGATVWQFGDHALGVFAESGGLTSMPDREAFGAFLPVTLADDELGEQIVKALDSSRAWSMDKFVATGGWRGAVPRFETWVADAMVHTGLRTRGALLKHVGRVLVQRDPYMLELTPLTHERGTSFYWHRDAKVKLDPGSSPRALGQAVRSIFAEYMRP